VSGEEPLDDQAGRLADAVFEFMEEFRPKGGVFGPELRGSLPPYEHRLGITRGPAFTVRDLVPAWEPPLPRFGTWVAPVEPFPVKTGQREIPEAFRRR
jgi:hypothetical protein